MSSCSPLAAFYQVILQVRANAAAEKGIFQKNEAATRAALIDPILRALGWNTADVRMVEPEHTVENKQSLDYVLKDAAGQVRAVIEAKKLGERLDKLGHVGALIGYAFSLKPQHFFITDGLIWHCYSPAHSHYQPIETLHLQDANAAEAALTLIRWLDAAQSGYGIQAPDPSPYSGVPIPRLSATPQPSAKPSTRAKKPEADTAPFIEVSQLQLLNLPAGQKPKQLQLPNGTIKQISTWKDILLEVCRLALSSSPPLPIPFPDKAGKKRLLIATDKQPVGASTSVLHQGKLLFIGTNYSKGDCIANALYVMQQLPTNEKSTALAVSF